MNKAILLTSAYLAPVEYYVQMYHAPKVLIEQCDHYVKQTYRNRCRIASANGVQDLSIPIVRPETTKAFTRDIRIADHGNWRHLHWNAIVSAYNSTPFFEYYEDDFRPFFEQPFPFLFDFNEQLRSLVCRLLDFEPSVAYTNEYVALAETEDVLDLRDAIHPKKAALMENVRSYYQVFDGRFGFQPNLSIIDLLFNMGPEALLWIDAYRPVVTD